VQRAPGAEVEDQANAAPDIFTALQEQLGLSLEKTKGRSDALFIAPIEKSPTGNCRLVCVLADIICFRLKESGHHARFPFAQGLLTSRKINVPASGNSDMVTKIGVKFF